MLSFYSESLHAFSSFMYFHKFWPTVACPHCFIIYMSGCETPDESTTHSIVCHPLKQVPIAYTLPYRASTLFFCC